MPRVPALLPALALALAGCAMDGSEVLPPVVVHTPLAFDPTDSYELPAWWTNGKQMLHLDENGAYALYATTSRYRLPFERGRWSQSSWTALRLEPYARLPRDAVRATVDMVDGRLVLALPRYERMAAIPGPPRVPEDDLLGAWSGPAGALDLGADGHYAFSPPPARRTEPVRLAGHRGRWILEGDELLLEPAPPNMDPIALRVEREGGGIVLAGPDLELRRIASARAEATKP